MSTKPVKCPACCVVYGRCNWECGVTTRETGEEVRMCFCWECLQELMSEIENPHVYKDRLKCPLFSDRQKQMIKSMLLVNRLM